MFFNKKLNASTFTKNLISIKYTLIGMLLSIQMNDNLYYIHNIAKKKKCKFQNKLKTLSK